MEEREKPLKFLAKIAKSGELFYVAIPVDFVKSDLLQHGKKYQIIIQEADV